MKELTTTERNIVTGGIPWAPIAIMVGVAVAARNELRNQAQADHDRNCTLHD